MTQATHREVIEEVIARWEAALAGHDAEGLLATYAEDATLESPLVPHLTGKDRGVLRGHRELRPFFEKVVERTPEVRHYDRGQFFTDGETAMWEYPREAQGGEQMDFVEVMKVRDGLIDRHRVYWGWRGVSVILGDQYHR